VGLENPHIEEVSYQHPAGYDGSAVRLVVYLFRRPDDRKNAGVGSRWSTVPRERRFGDARAFIRAANARTREIREDAERRGKDLSRNKARWCTSFVNVVLSPSNRAGLSDGDFGKLLEPWVRDADGRELPFVAAIHREEPGRAHLHASIVRDKFGSGELKVLKERTDGLAISLGLQQELEREQELALGGVVEMSREELSDGLEL
jgi:hypothetical protein